MSWSKGAVVIKKYGNQEEWADTIEKCMNIQKASNKELEEMRRENAYLRMRTTKQLIEDMEDAEIKYGRHWTPPKWAKGIIECFALIVYGVCTFIDKYLRL